MAELFKVNAPVRKPLFEGVQGENEARSIQFDITPWVEELGDGAVTATAKRSQDSQPYPVTITVDSTTATWKPTSTDTAFAGVGSFQLEYTVDSVLAKTCIWSTMVAPSLDPAGDPPDPYDNWLAEMREIEASTIQAKQDAEQAVDDAHDEVEDAEAWATGKRNGQDVPETDPTYHNNSKYYAEQSAENQYGAYIVKSASGQIASFADGADDVPMKSVKVAIVPKQSGSGDPSPSNVRPITGTSTLNVVVSPTTEAEDGTTTPVPLGQTVYGANVDVTEGEMKITKLGVDLGSLTWADTQSAPDADGRTVYYTSAVWGTPTGGELAICSIAVQYAPVPIGQLHVASQGFTLTGGNFSTVWMLYIDHARTGAQVKSELNGQMLVANVYGAQQTVQLTPAQVASLLGTNNVWSDAGSVEVGYRADPTLAYNELANVIVSLGGNI